MSGTAMRSATVLLAALLFVALCPAGRAAEFYVATDGDDAAAGTISQPWRTLGHALRQLGPGDTLTLKPGTYKGAPVLNLHGLEDSPVVIRGADRDSVIIDGTLRREGEYAGGRDGIKLENSSWVVIENLTSIGAQRAGIFMVHSHSITVRNCLIADNGVWGVMVDHSPDVLVEGCDISGSGREHGIYFSNGGTDRAIARGNRIHGNSACGIHINGDPDYGAGGIISRFVVENNEIFRNGRPNGGSAINMTFAQDGIVRNNLVYDNYAGGIVVYRDTPKAPNLYSKGIRILHNTVWFPEGQGRWTCAVQRESHHQTVKNNIFVGGDFGTYCVMPDSIRGHFSDNNVIWTYDGQLKLGDTRVDISYTLDAWQAMGHDVNSVFADPMFVAPEEGDFRVRPGSPAIGLAEPVGVVHDDFEGTARPATGATAGCFERPAMPE